jgi:hypothetical protein
MTTPMIKHQLTQVTVGNIKNIIADTVIIVKAKNLLTYYFKLADALLISNAPPAALKPRTVKRK